MLEALLGRRERRCSGVEPCGEPRLEPTDKAAERAPQRAWDPVLDEHEGVVLVVAVVDDRRAAEQARPPRPTAKGPGSPRTAHRDASAAHAARGEGRAQDARRPVATQREILDPNAVLVTLRSEYRLGLASPRRTRRRRARRRGGRDGAGGAQRGCSGVRRPEQPSTGETRLDGRLRLRLPLRPERVLELLVLGDRLLVVIVAADIEPVAVEEEGADRLPGLQQSRRTRSGKSRSLSCC